MSFGVVSVPSARSTLFSPMVYNFTVSGNTIFDDTYGMWFTPSTVGITGINTNHFSVTERVHRAK